MAARHSPDGRQQEKRERLAVAADAWPWLIPLGLVPLPSHTRGHEACQDRPARWAKQGSRKRRNRDRRQGQEPRLCQEAAEKAYRACPGRA